MPKKPWFTATCFNCHGTGQVSDYGYFGLDFEGPKECDRCGGSGTIFVSPNKKAVAEYPGGPFQGQPIDSELESARRYRCRN